MFEQFMDHFTYSDSASRQVQLFIKVREFSSDQPAPSLIFFHLQWYFKDSLPYPKHMLRAHYISMSLATVICECSLYQFSTSLHVIYQFCTSLSALHLVTLFVI